MFDLQNNRGFTMKFDNGWTVSVKWGDGNYCTNYHFPIIDKATGDLTSMSAEIAAWDDKGKWFVFERNVFDEGTEDEYVSEHTVKGWLSPNEVLEFMQLFAKMEPSNV